MAKAEISTQATQNHNQKDDRQSRHDQNPDRDATFLAITAGSVTVYLTAMLVLSLRAAVLEILALTPTSLGMAGAEPQTLLLTIYAGALGSSVMALRSVIERIANGWELSDGTKLPASEPEDKFVARMIPGFLARPFLGSAVGFFNLPDRYRGFLDCYQPKYGI